MGLVFEFSVEWFFLCCGLFLGFCFVLEYIVEVDLWVICWGVSCRGDLFCIFMSFSVAKIVVS